MLHTRLLTPSPPKRLMTFFRKQIKQRVAPNACKEFFFERGLSKSFKKVNYFSFGLHVIRISLVCTCMSSVCHSYVLVCHP